MRNFILWDGSADVELGAIGVAHTMQLPPVAKGNWLPISGAVADFTLARVGEALVEVPRALPATVGLAAARTARWIEAKAYRETRMAAGCKSPKGSLQTDAASQRKIDSAARQALAWKTNKQLSLLGIKITVASSWSIDWTMADDTVVNHDADAMLAAADAVTTFVTGCQVSSRAVRTKIFAATTIAAVAAVDITSGYPS